MKSLVSSIILLFIFWLQSCSTVSEVFDPNDSPLGYSEKQNEEGKTIYVRKRRLSGPRDLPVTTEVEPDLLLDDNIVSTAAPIRPSLSKDESGFIFEGAFQDDYIHIGPGFEFRSYDSPLSLKLGVSLFSGIEASYAGFDLAGRWHIFKMGDIEPLVGAGLFLGDRKECKEVFEERTLQEECIKSFLSAAYLEFGLKIKRFTVFVRDYGITDAGLKVPTKRFFGIGVLF